jgi:dTDP-4-dehydrorhamnose reductase
MRVLVTGGSGLIGWSLIQRLPAHWQVFATVHQNTRLALLGARITCVPIDLKKPQAGSALVAAIKPDVVIHTASMSDPEQVEQNRRAAWLLNVVATRNLVRSAKTWNTHFIFCSTIYVFDGQNAPYYEIDRPKPVNFYGWTKLIAERITRAHSDRLLLLRLTTTYGWHLPGQRQNWVTWLLARLAQGAPVLVANDVVTNYIWAEDVAQALVNGVERKVCGLIHVGGLDTLSRYAFSLLIADTFGLDSAPIAPVSSDQLSNLAQRPKNTDCSIAMFTGQLGLRPTPIANALKRMKDQQMSQEQLVERWAGASIEKKLPI